MMGGAVQAATLGFGQPVLQDNGLWGIPVLLHAGSNENVAGLQFRLSFEQRGFSVVDVVTGPSAASAGKEAVCSALGDGARVVVAGMNLERIADGEVAQVYLRATRESGDAASVALDSPVLSDPMGHGVDAAIENGRITCSIPSQEKPAEEGKGAKAASSQKTGADKSGKTGHSSGTPEDNAGYKRLLVDKAGSSWERRRGQGVPVESLGRVPGGNPRTSASSRQIDQDRNSTGGFAGPPSGTTEGSGSPPNHAQSTGSKGRPSSDASAPPGPREAFAVAALFAGRPAGSDWEGGASSAAPSSSNYMNLQDHPVKLVVCSVLLAVVMIFIVGVVRRTLLRKGPQQRHFHHSARKHRVVK
jgi:hypothetical protein